MPFNRLFHADSLCEHSQGIITWGAGRAGSRSWRRRAALGAKGVGVKILSGDSERVTQNVRSELGIAINGALFGTETENRPGAIVQRTKRIIERYTR